MMIAMTWGVAAICLLTIVALLLSSGGAASESVADRLQRVSQPAGRGASPARLNLTLPNTTAQPARRSAARERQKKTLRDRLVQAGMYRDRSGAVFLMSRFTLFCTPVACGVFASAMGAVPLLHALVFGALLGLVGTLAPSFWLDYLKRNRQTKMRRALPDALDIVVVCLEGGLSLSAAFSRVATELAAAHALLALELKIVEREVQMGRTTGEAMRAFADRFDVEELRSMAAVISQAEKYGSSVTRALNVYADTLRLKRQQRAEELAHKSAVKLLFPTVLLIFPALFYVILGPAAFQIQELFNSTLKGGIGIPGN